MKKVIISLTFLLISLFNCLFAQTTFERLYDSDVQYRQTVEFKISDAGEIIFLNIVTGSNLDEETANLTKLSPKGDVIWSKNYEFEQIIIRNGDLIFAEDGGYYLLAYLEETIPMNDVVIKLDADGNIEWSHILGDPETSQSFEFVYGNAQILKNEQNELTIFGKQGDSFGGGFYGVKLDGNGELIWSNRYTNPGLGGLRVGPRDILPIRDNDYMIVSPSTLTYGADVILADMDANGEINWANRYGFEEFNLSNPLYPYAITQAPDEGYVVVGSQDFDDIPVNNKGLIMKTDSLGEVLWKNTISIDTVLNGTLSLILNDVMIDQYGDIFTVGEVTINDAGLRSYLVSLKFDQSGTLLNANAYREHGGFSYTNVDTLRENGLIIFGNKNGNADSTPYLLKVDNEGQSGCSQLLSVLVEQTDTIPTNPMPDYEITPLDTTQAITISTVDYNGFTVPTLNLAPPPLLCEGDPIDISFDATTEDAIFYQWNTGATAPVIEVDEPGTYSVQVGFDEIEQGCFLLCDTVSVVPLAMPTVEIATDIENFCLNGFGELIAQPQGLVDDLLWNTGNTTPNLTIDEPNTYEVTVSNACGSQSAEVDIPAFPLLSPSVNVLEIADSICFQEQGEIVVQASNINAAGLTWSTSDGEIIDGFNQEIVTIGTPGQYHLLAENFCESVTTTITIENEIPTVNLLFEEDNFCTTGFANLSFVGENFANFSWSDGATTMENEVTESGIYTIEVSNNCGNAVDSIALLCESSLSTCLNIPNAFTPNQDGTNDYFLPVIKAECLLNIDINYLKIFDRWGNQVYETQEKVVGWDGKIKNSSATADVYLFLIEVENSVGEVNTLQGDVTLIR